MSVLCLDSSYIRRQLQVLVVNNIRKGLIFIRCSLNILLFQSNLFLRHCTRLLGSESQCSCLLIGDQMAQDNPADNLNTKNGNFICGVVEGRPMSY